jgi:hypothetical protein
LAIIESLAQILLVSVGRVPEDGLNNLGDDCGEAVP